LPLKLPLLLLHLPPKQNLPQKNNRRLGVLIMKSPSCKSTRMTGFFHHE
jgi:hypothetical protein